MGTSEVLHIVLIVAGIVALAALIWLLVELVMTVRKARDTVDAVQKQLEPTLANVEELTEGCKPIISKVDPLMDRATLTIDAVNLEIMRVDKILEDAGDITSKATSAVNAVDAVANTPLSLINTASTRLRDAFKPKAASDESAALGEAKAAEAAKAASKTASKAAGETTGEAPSEEASAPEAAAQASKAPAAEGYFTMPRNQDLAEDAPVEASR